MSVKFYYLLQSNFIVTQIGLDLQQRVYGTTSRHWSKQSTYSDIVSRIYEREKERFDSDGGSDVGVATTATTEMTLCFLL